MADDNTTLLVLGAIGLGALVLLGGSSPAPAPQAPVGSGTMPTCPSGYTLNTATNSCVASGPLACPAIAIVCPVPSIAWLACQSGRTL